MAGDYKTANASEVDIDKIMERIRGEVARRRKDAGGNAVQESQDQKIEKAPIDISMIRSVISSAETHADIARAPSMLKFRGLSRKLAVFTGKKIAYLSSFITNKQRNFNITAIHALKTLGDNLEKLSERTVTLGSEEVKAIKAVEEIRDRLGLTESAVESVNAEYVETKNDIEKIRTQITAANAEHVEAKNDIEKIRTQITAANAEYVEAKNDIEEIRTQITAANAEHVEAKNAIEEIKAQITAAVESGKTDQEESMTTLVNTINEKAAKIEELENAVSYLKYTITMQNRQISIFLEKAGKRLPEHFSAEETRSLVKVNENLLDSLYVSFEDQFRGTRESIKEIAKVYLPYIKETKVVIDDSPLLDIGCGRGEWLELLKENGLKAKGVDINSVFVKQCIERKLDVIESDAILYLRSQPDSSIGALTGLHIIEHLPFEMLISLLDETVRVLKPGGIVIFETPNPENILVGSCRFYLDPTHNKPLPSAMMKFMVETLGLSRVEILNLHPVNEADRLSGPDAADRFNDYFYGPQDYAVIGYKT